jgi:(E)-4-hydroxy-3-methylbut-2-enyl-diphosphate synthase
MTRSETYKIEVGNKTIGGENKLLIQSMCDVATSDVDKVVEEINACAAIGADLMRVSILDERDLEAIPKIKSRISIPLIGDIHFDAEFGIKAIERGIDAIRVNPGNTPLNAKLDRLIALAKKKNIPIRIGVNGGSNRYGKLETSEEIVARAVSWVEYFEKRNFHSLVLSVKSTDPEVTLASYRLLNKKTRYPLHIGLTESGFGEIGIIRSISVLAPLIREGIGDTIRISLTQDPIKEVLTAKRLLHDCGLYPSYPTIISCPTCGRTKVANLKEITQKTLEYLEKNNLNYKVAVMGCIVNGIGEGESADIGLAGADGKFIVFKKGKIVTKIDEKDALSTLFKEIDKLEEDKSN